jgi:hypothetical protein
MLIGFHSCITVVTLLLLMKASQKSDVHRALTVSLYWEAQYQHLHGNITVETYQHNNPEDGDTIISETSVRNSATRYKAPEGIYNWHHRESFPQESVFRILIIENYIRFEVFTVLTMKNGVFWDVTQYGSCKNRRFGGTYRHFHQGDKNRLTRNNARCSYCQCCSYITDSCIPDEGGAKFLRNFGSYNSHTE